MHKRRVGVSAGIPTDSEVLCSSESSLWVQTPPTSSLSTTHREGTDCTPSSRVSQTHVGQEVAGRSPTSVVLVWEGQREPFGRRGLREGAGNRVPIEFYYRVSETGAGKERDVPR